MSSVAARARLAGAARVRTQYRQDRIFQCPQTARAGWSWTPSPSEQVNHHEGSRRTKGPAAASAEYSKQPQPLPPSMACLPCRASPAQGSIFGRASWCDLNSSLSYQFSSKREGASGTELHGTISAHHFFPPAPLNRPKARNRGATLVKLPKRGKAGSQACN